MKKYFALAAAALVAASAAQASTVSFSDTIATATTNWTDNLTLQQFDGSLGTLTSVKFLYGGSVITSFSVESRDAAPATVTATANAIIKFGVPLSQDLTVTNSQVQGVSAFDGVVDFGGTSGFGPLTITGSDNDVATFSSGLGAYIGLGTYDIQVQALGSSTASGAGNLVTLIQTQANANITVEYTYDNPIPKVPEPASLALVGLALAGAAFASRRRKT